MDGQRILKLLAETSCAARGRGVEISLPPGTVTGEGETPSHWQRGKPRSQPRQRTALGHGLRASGATRQRETSGPWPGEDPEPPGKGKPRALGPGRTRSHPAKGNPGATGPRKTRSHRRRGNSPPPGAGATPGHPATGIFEPLARGGPEPPRQRDTSGPRAWGDPEPPATGYLGPFGLGVTRSHRQGATSGHRYEDTPEPPGEGESPGPLARGGTLSHPAERNSALPARGQPRAVSKGENSKPPRHGDS